ncbi:MULTISPECIES: hypothetical protein [Nocardia]|uniref:hypothetical protein n=1 Tax=Nocardia TaxID=1817 RepID=UPI00237EA918|nr:MULTISPECIES: hypothetical protein [Nocardia]MDE1669922.1 hypothetical protein [Nocardia gipuzkoensis]
MPTLIDSQIRSLASRRGLRLTKHHGRYFRVDPRINAVIAGGQIGSSPDEIVDHLTAS